MMNSGGIGVPLGFPLGPTSVIQVTNLSSAVTSEQMRTLFGFLGDIEELRLYPPDNAPLAFSSKVCYIKFREASSVGVAQHLTNTVFIDRALIVVPCAEGKIPDEAKALSLLAPAPTMTSLMPGAGLLPIPTPTPLTTLGVSLGTLGALPAAALDPNITALGEISQPPIMGNVDPSKIDEIRRTVYVGNLNSQTTTADQLLEFFKQVGEVKFVRMAGDETQPTRFAFVEFADQNSVPRALAFNGVMFGDRPLKINHSNNAIVKPPEMTPQAAAKELEEVMKRVREAQSFISAAIEPESGKSSERKGGRSRSHSRSESRSSSKSRSRRKRSNSKHSRSGNRSLSRHKDRRRSRSPLKKRSRSRERQKSRSHSHSWDKKRDKEKEKDRDRNREKERDRDRDKERERERDKERNGEKEQNKGRERARDKDRDREKDEKEVDQNKEKDDVEKEGEKDREKIKDKEGDKDRGDKEKEKDEDKKEQEREKEKKKEKIPRTPPRSYSSSRRSRSSSRERHKRKSRSPSKSPKTTRRKSSQTPSPRRNKKEKKREKDTNNERREGEHSTSKKKSSKEKEGKEKSDKSTTTLKDKDHPKEDPNSEADKEVGNRDTQRTDEVKLQQNGNYQPNDKNLSVKMEEV
ncbi:uncharacterized protein LOC141917763 isoform X4 [Strix aluco]|uniref:uncharacterized protein LOC141917763 isoform X4 n=2 Tax=Strix aluco TaxID=111821 RepID=UPI003DA213CF